MVGIQNYFCLILFAFISFSFINIKDNDKISLEKNWVLESRINDTLTYKAQKKLPENCECFEFSKDGTYSETIKYETSASEIKYETSKGTWEIKSDSILILKTQYFLQSKRIIKLTKNRLVLKKTSLFSKPKPKL